MLPQLEFGEGEAGASISVNINPLEVVEESSKELFKISPLCSVHMNVMVVDQPARLIFLKRNLLIAQQASFFILIFRMISCEKPAGRSQIYASYLGICRSCSSN